MMNKIDETQEQAEHRAFPRRAGRADVRCRFGKWGMGPEAKGKLVDISQGGALIVVNKEPPAGKPLTAEFFRTSWRDCVLVEGTITRVAKADDKAWLVAFRFEKLLSYENLSRIVQ